MVEESFEGEGEERSGFVLALCVRREGTGLSCEGLFVIGVGVVMSGARLVYDMSSV